MWFFAVLLSVALLIFGNALSFYQLFTNQLTERLASRNISIGLNVIFFFGLAFSLFFALYHLWLGIGLLKAKAMAWYVQIVAATLGLILIPYGTVISIVILIFFFRSNVRSFFKV